MSLTTPAPQAPSNHVSASSAQAKVRQAAGGPSGQGGPSHFAQWLQGAMEEDDTVAANASPAGEPKAEEPAHEHEDDAAPGEHRPAAKGDERAAGSDASAPQSAQPELSPPEQRIADFASMAHRAGAMAAARTRPAGADTLASRLQALDKLGDAAGSHARALSLAADARDATAQAQGIDISAFKPTLDAATVNLAPADTATASAAAAADFSLPSLGAAGNSAPQPAATPSMPAQATLAPSPGTAAFPAALGAQLNTWMKDGVQYATLELNPKDMGPIDVRIALRDGRTEVQLGAEVAATRAALADALPSLADALGDVGLSLAGGSVSDQTGQNARPGDQPGQQRAVGLPEWMVPARDAAGAADPSPGVSRRGLVDLVA